MIPLADQIRQMVREAAGWTESDADAAISSLAGATSTTAGAALVMLAEEAERLAISDLQSALGATHRLVEEADRREEVVARARARRARAQALAYANRFDEALAELSTGIGIAADAGEVVEAARGRLASLHALARRGRLDEAIAAGEAARREFLAAEQPSLAAKADINLGVVHRMRDAPREAIVHFDRARPLLLSEPVIVAQLDSNRAEALLDLNEFTPAEEAFGVALAAFEGAGMVRAAAIVEGNLADLMSRQGRLDRALELFEHARRRLGEADAPGDAARLESERAETLAAIGLHAEAAEALREILPVLSRHGLAWEAARSRVTLARSLIRLGELEQAEHALNEAAGAFVALDHATGAARADLLRADLLARRGDLDAAAALTRSALTVLEPRPADRAAALLQLATISLQAGDMVDAAARLDLAGQAAERLDLPPLTVDLLHANSRLHRAQGQNDSALILLRRAVDQIERVRGTLRADHLRAAFLGDRASIYEECFGRELDAAPLATEGVAAAFGVAERAKSRALLDMLHGGADLALPAGEDAAEAVLLAQLATGRAELNALYTRLDTALVSRQPQRDPEQWQTRMRECERNIASIQRRLAATSRFSGVFAEPIGLAAAQAMLPPGSALLQFFLEGGHTSVLVVRPGSAEAFRRTTPMESVHAAMERLAFQINKAIARGSSAVGGALATIRELQALHGLLLGPLQGALAGVTTLHILPHGVLHALPFHALHDGEAHLLERSEVLYAPSASVLAHLPTRREPSSVGRPAVVVGLADPIAPLAEREARDVASAIEASGRAVVLLVGEGATRQRFLEEARSAGLVHLATHARFSATEPLTSGVRLKDGWLTVRDALTAGLDGAAVTLSACDSGRSVVTAGDELLGLIRGFLVGGAASVLTSLWPVHDRTTAELMAALYTMWYSDSSCGGADLAASLRTAQIELLRRGVHPAAWAPFAFVGMP